MNFDLIIEILGFSVGILYLWWEYHADNRLWFASMVMPAISMWIYFNKGLYADFSINIYYLAIAVYGYIVWTKGTRNKEQRTKNNLYKNNQESTGVPKSKQEYPGNPQPTTPITHTPRGMIAVCIAGAATLWVLLYLGLNYLTDSTVPVADAFTTALSIVGMWMLARKYLEQWLVWIAVDAVCVGLYIYKGIYLYAILYSLYTVVAIFGYRKWVRIMHTQKE